MLVFNRCCTIYISGGYLGGAYFTPNRCLDICVKLPQNERPCKFITMYEENNDDQHLIIYLLCSSGTLYCISQKYCGYQKLKNDDHISSPNIDNNINCDEMAVSWGLLPSKSNQIYPQSKTVEIIAHSVELIRTGFGETLGLNKILVYKQKDCKSFLSYSHKLNHLLQNTPEYSFPLSSGPHFRHTITPFLVSTFYSQESYNDYRFKTCLILDITTVINTNPIRYYQIVTDYGFFRINNCDNSILIDDIWVTMACLTTNVIYRDRCGDFYTFNGDQLNCNEEEDGLVCIKRSLHKKMEDVVGIIAGVNWLLVCCEKKPSKFYHTRLINQGHRTDKKMYYYTIGLTSITQVLKICIDTETNRLFLVVNADDEREYYFDDETIIFNVRTNNIEKKTDENRVFYSAGTISMFYAQDNIIGTDSISFYYLEGRNIMRKAMDKEPPSCFHQLMPEEQFFNVVPPQGRIVGKIPYYFTSEHPEGKISLCNLPLQSYYINSERLSVKPVRTLRIVEVGSIPPLPVLMDIAMREEVINDFQYILEWIIVDANGEISSSGEGVTRDRLYNAMKEFESRFIIKDPIISFSPEFYRISPAVVSILGIALRLASDMINIPWMPYLFYRCLRTVGLSSDGEDMMYMIKIQKPDIYEHLNSMFTSPELLHEAGFTDLSEALTTAYPIANMSVTESQIMLIFVESFRGKTDPLVYRKNIGSIAVMLSGEYQKKISNFQFSFKSPETHEDWSESLYELIMGLNSENQSSLFMNWSGYPYPDQNNIYTIKIISKTKTEIEYCTCTRMITILAGIFDNPEDLIRELCYPEQAFNSA
jgi:hypothetical protein